MQITLIKNTSKYSIQLPEKIQGKYWLTSYDNDSYMKIIAIEAINGMWQLNADKYSEIVLKDHSVDKIIFDPNNIYRIVSLFDEEPCLLFAEGFDSNSTYFGKYNIIAAEGLDISIGRENCDITYPKKYISTNHASLMFYKGKWSICVLFTRFSFT